MLYCAVSLFAANQELDPYIVSTLAVSLLKINRYLHPPYFPPRVLLFKLPEDKIEWEISRAFLKITSLSIKLVIKQTLCIQTKCLSWPNHCGLLAQILPV